MSATETPSVRREADAPAPATATTRLGIEGMRCAPVKGAYTPDVIVADHGKPLRLTFRREEAAACSEKALLTDFNRFAELAEGKLVPLDFTPEQAGKYEFTCDMGMLHDKIVVR